MRHAPLPHSRCQTERGLVRRRPCKLGGGGEKQEGKTARSSVEMQTVEGRAQLELKIKRLGKGRGRERNTLLNHQYIEAREREMATKSQQHVLIIGAGVGGASLAARLSHRGYKVTVVEKVPHFSEAEFLL